jgi:hypothetical protein
MKRLAVMALTTVAACGGAATNDDGDGTSEAGTGGGGEVDLLLDHHDFGGDLFIEGRVALPPGTSAQQARVQAYEADQPNSQIAHTTYSISPRTSFHYRVENLAADSGFKIYVEADLDDENGFDGPGDARGFYDGTVNAPLPTFDDGVAIELGSESLTDVDFGIGMTN